MVCLAINWEAVVQDQKSSRHGLQSTVLFPAPKKHLCMGLGKFEAGGCTPGKEREDYLMTYRLRLAFSTSFPVTTLKLSVLEKSSPVFHSCCCLRHSSLGSSGLSDLTIPQPFIFPSSIVLITNCLISLPPGLLVARPVDSKLLADVGPCFTNLCVPHTRNSNIRFGPELAYGVEQMDKGGVRECSHLP